MELIIWTVKFFINVATMALFFSPLFLFAFLIQKLICALLIKVLTSSVKG